MNDNLKHFIILLIIIILGSLIIGTMGYYMEGIHSWITYTLIGFICFSGIALIFTMLISLISYDD